MLESESKVFTLYSFAHTRKCIEIRKHLKPEWSLRPFASIH